MWIFQTEHTRSFYDHLVGNGEDVPNEVTQAVSVLKFVIRLVPVPVQIQL